MLITISPAKSLNWDPAPQAMTEPAFASDAVRLAKTARQLPLKGLKSLMGISDDLARLNRDRFKVFSEAPEVEVLRPAALAFNGDTYQGLMAAEFDEAEMAFAQDRLRILSGLYGLLKPLDGIQPYRLEMGSRLKTRRGGSLYEYWGDQIAKALKAEAEALGTDALLNCASKEYFSAADRPKLGLRVITPSFLEEKDGEARMISFYAKRARGALARFVITQRITDPSDLVGFDLGGYRLDADRSTEDAPVFVRPQPEAKAA